jgi:hypothetical protein
MKRCDYRPQPFGFIRNGQLSRYCHGNCGKSEKNCEQKVNTTEKLTLVLYRNWLILLGKTSAPANS